MKNLTVTLCLTLAVFLGSAGMGESANPPLSPLEDIKFCSEDILDKYIEGVNLSEKIYVYDKFIDINPEYKNLYNARKYELEYHARIELAKYILSEITTVDGVLRVEIPIDPFLLKFKKRYFCKFTEGKDIIYRFIGKLP